MSGEKKSEDIDSILDLLSNPLTRYILSVLAGVDPGSFAGTIEIRNKDKETH